MLGSQPVYGCRGEYSSKTDVMIFTNFSETSIQDVEQGEIVLDEMCSSVRKCLEGITKPVRKKLFYFTNAKSDADIILQFFCQQFVIPGSIRELQLEIYVTVIVHSPFFTNSAQQVIVQGWLVTSKNVVNLMNTIERELNLLEEKVAQVTSLVNQQLESIRTESEKLVGGLFEENSIMTGKNNSNLTKVPMVSPEISFINMLRYGMLALSYQSTAVPVSKKFLISYFLQ